MSARFTLLIAAALLLAGCGGEAGDKITGRLADYFLADGQAWRCIVHPGDLPRLEEAAARLRRGEPTEQEYRIVRPDGVTLTRIPQSSRRADSRRSAARPVVKGPAPPDRARS